MPYQMFVRVLLHVAYALGNNRAPVRTELRNRFCVICFQSCRAEMKLTDLQMLCEKSPCLLAVSSCSEIGVDDAESSVVSLPTHHLP